MNFKNKDITFYKEIKENLSTKRVARVVLYAVVECKNKIINKCMKPKVYEKSAFINRESGKIIEFFSSIWKFKGCYVSDDDNLFLNNIFNDNKLYFSISDWEDRGLSPKELNIKRVII